jgi:formylglycine-generating enzyme required for sulfatase activity
VEISCNVSAAKVFLNGTYMGETPLADREILPGGYKLRVEKQGYETYQRDITVEKNRSASFYVDLSEKVITAPVVAPAVSSRESDKKSFTNSIGMTFVYIPPGEFMMGSPENEPGRDSDEKQHKVKLTKGFYMQTTEVTQGQWKAVMGDNPSYFKDCGDDCPAENVSWDDVQEFIKKLNQKEGKTYRLPIEAEWEYACRAGTQTALYTGDIKILGSNNAPALDGIAWYGGNSCVEYSGGYDCSGWTEKQYGCPKCGTHSVGKKKPNSWGLYDMYGNVWEWCHDWYGDYASGSVIDPVGPVSGSNRVFRGGCWADSAQYCRSAGRGGYSPDYRAVNLGFRPVLLPGQQR